MKKTLFLGAILGVAICNTAFATDYNVSGSNTGTASFNEQYSDGLTLNNGDALGLNLSQEHNTRTLDYLTAAKLTPDLTFNGGNISLSDSVWYLSGTTTINEGTTTNIVGSNAKFITFAKLTGAGNITSTKNNGDGSAARALQLIGDNSGYTGTITLVNNNGNNSEGTNYVVVSHKDAITNASVVLTDNTRTNAIALNVASSSVKTISGKGDIVIAKAANMDGAAELTAAALSVTSASTFTAGVGAGVTLNLAAGSNMTLTSFGTGASVTGSGTLTIQTGELQYHDATGMDSFTGDVIIKSVLHIGANSNKFNAAHSLTVAEGGAINAWANGGSFTHALTLAGGALNLDGNNRDFSGAITLADNTTSQITNAANTLTLSGGISGTGSLTKKNAGTFTISGTTNSFKTLKAEGGTVNIEGATTLSGSLESGPATINVKQDVTVGNFASTGNGGHINITDNATLSVSDSSSGQGLWLDPNSSVTVANGSTLEIGGDKLTVTAANASGATIERLGEGAAKLGVTGLDAHRKNVKVSNASINYTGSDMLYLGSVEGSTVTATGANATFVSLKLNGETVTLGSMTQGAADYHENYTLTLNNLIVGETAGSTINANLVIADNGTLDFRAGQTLTMGCEVTLGSGVTVLVSGDTYQALADHTEGVSLTLFEGVSGFSGPAAITVSDGMQSNVFFMNYEGGSLTIVPEPATATLSLLALAGLAARRRRH